MYGTEDIDVEVDAEEEDDDGIKELLLVPAEEAILISITSNLPRPFVFIQIKYDTNINKSLLRKIKFKYKIIENYVENGT